MGLVTLTSRSSWLSCILLLVSSIIFSLLALFSFSSALSHLPFFMKGYRAGMFVRGLFSA